MKYNWIENNKIKLIFKCKNCAKENNFNTIARNYDVDKNIFMNSNCQYCHTKCLDYVSHSGSEILSTLKEEFEQNGRVGIRTRLAGGNVIYHSKTREMYEKTGKTETIYAKGLKEKLCL